MVEATVLVPSLLIMLFFDIFMGYGGGPVQPFTHQMGVVLSGVRGRCRCGPDYARRQPRRCSAPWGAYSAGSSPLPHTPPVFCVQLIAGRGKKDQEIKGMSNSDGGREA